MTVTDTLKLVVLSLLLAVSATASAQDVPDDAADIILTIEELWEAEQSGDKDWLDDMLVDEFSAWPNNAPAPRSKSSMQLWDRFASTQGRMIEHELYFQNIAVYEDVAVVQYFYTSAYEDNDGDVEVTNGRYSDILVRTDDGWKFLAWHGGDDDE